MLREMEERLIAVVLAKADQRANDYSSARKGQKLSQLEGDLYDMRDSIKSDFQVEYKSKSLEHLLKPKRPDKKQKTDVSRSRSRSTVKDKTNRGKAGTTAEGSQNKKDARSQRGRSRSNNSEAKQSRTSSKTSKSSARKKDRSNSRSVSNKSGKASRNSSRASNTSKQTTKARSSSSQASRKGAKPKSKGAAKGGKSRRS